MSEETKYCSNCRKNISKSNFDLHDVHCKKNIIICDKCSDPVPRREMEDHLRTQHAPVSCKKCKSLMELWEADDHKDTCVKRPIPCIFCNLDCAWDGIKEHESYCGSRTEQCETCKKRIMRKDWEGHQEICGQASASPLSACHMQHITCTVCKKNFPEDAIEYHEKFCSSRSDFCEHCKKLVKVADWAKHFEECQGKSPKPINFQQSIPCTFCEVNFDADVLEVHKIYCASKIKQCKHCKEDVVLKQWRAHLEKCSRSSPSLPKTITCPFCNVKMLENYQETHLKFCVRKFNHEELQKSPDDTVNQNLASFNDTNKFEKSDIDAITPLAGSPFAENTSEEEKTDIITTLVESLKLSTIGTPSAASEDEKELKYPPLVPMLPPSIQSGEQHDVEDMQLDANEEMKDVRINRNAAFPQLGVEKISDSKTKVADWLDQLRTPLSSAMDNTTSLMQQISENSIAPNPTGDNKHVYGSHLRNPGYSCATASGSGYSAFGARPRFSKSLVPSSSASGDYSSHSRTFRPRYSAPRSDDSTSYSRQQLPKSYQAANPAGGHCSSFATKQSNQVRMNDLTVPCPICKKDYPVHDIQSHVENCYVSDTCPHCKMTLSPQDKDNHINECTLRRNTGSEKTNQDSLAPVRGKWNKSKNSSRRGTSALTQYAYRNEEILIPCEFCSELFNTFAITQHQSGCRPDLLHYSSNKADEQPDIVPAEQINSGQKSSTTVLAPQILDELPQRNVSSGEMLPVSPSVDNDWNSSQSTSTRARGGKRRGTSYSRNTKFIEQGNPGEFLTTPRPGYPECYQIYDQIPIPPPYPGSQVMVFTAVYDPQVQSAFPASSYADAARRGSQYYDKEKRWRNESGKGHEKMDSSESETDTPKKGNSYGAKSNKYSPKKSRKGKKNSKGGKKKKK